MKSTASLYLHLVSLSRLFAGILVISSFFSIVVLASDPFSNLSSSLSFGRLQGEAKEYVYRHASRIKMSELDWKIKSASILKGDLSWHTPSSLTLNLKTWTIIKRGEGYMDDYDWDDASNPYKLTHHSWHSDTSLDHASELDLNARILILNEKSFKVHTLIGYQKNKYTWTSRGGYFIYPGRSGKFRDGVKAISYEQTFNMPYIGLTFRYLLQSGFLQAGLKYSSWVQAKDIDEHYGRGLTFHEKADSSDFVGFDFLFGYKIAKDLTLIAEYTKSHYKHTIADTTAVDNASGEVNFFEDGAGISNETSIFTLGMGYRF